MAEIMNKYIVMLLVMNSSIAYADKDVLVTSILTNRLVENNYSNLQSVNLLPTVKNSSNYNNLLNFSKKEIKVVIVGLEDKFEPLTISAQVSYYSVVISDTKEIVVYLNNLGIKNNDAIKIANTLAAGISTSNKCTGERNSCLISNQNLEFVNDYYDKVLRIFIPSSYFKKKRKKEKYLKDDGLSNLWITKFYGNYEHNSSSSYFSTLDNYIGLGPGYLNFNGLINQQDQDVKSAQYVYNFNKYTLLFGLNDNINDLSDITQNSFLSDKKFTGVTFAKTNNLLVKNIANNSIQFFTPSEGTLEVKKDGKVIFQKYVQSGQNSLFYSELPPGSYNVSLTVTNNKNIIYQGDDYIYNLNYGDSGSSPYARVGKVEINDLDYNDLEVGISYPIFDSFKLLLNSYLIGNDFYYSTGLRYRGEQFNTSLNYSKGNAEEKTRFNLNYGFLFLQVTRNKNDNQNDKYYKITTQNNTQANLSANYQLDGKTNLYSSVFYNKYDNNNDENYDFNVGLTRRFDNNISINTSYAIRNDNNLFSVNISIPLGNNINYSGSINSSEDYNQFYSSINYTDKLYGKNITITPSATYTPENDDSWVKSINASINSNNKNYDSSLRIGSNNSDVNYGISFSTTQVVSDYGIDYTNENTLSSLYINAPNSSDILGTLNLINSSNGNNREYNLKDGQKIYIPTYSQDKINYSINNNIFLRNSTINNRNNVDFIPGKMKTLSLDVIDSSSITVINSGLENINCKGSACLKKTPIQNNVVDLIVEPDKYFEILLGEKICWQGNLSKLDKKAIVCGE
ncbi:TcfC E-set like domain-containing protein [Photobacterium kishitanii]|uniref:Pilus assembly protein E-set like domain-containing protein n=1 Tax=Photobacterium kishitanii TaxID=318456 RepID=A0A2T3KBR6_9GAMM|nr:TcfC E-set like domain-containing protein [Photobacterium kishitanii]PSU92056.1 hypothetical protein C9J27_22610 [Photobacterium kishitanii]